MMPIMPLDKILRFLATPHALVTVLRRRAPLPARRLECQSRGVRLPWLRIDRLMPSVGATLRK